jgi:hypothetical protein
LLQQNKINKLTILGSWLWCSSKFLTVAIVSWALESDQALIWEFVWHTLSKFLLISSLCPAILVLVNAVLCQVVSCHTTGNKGHGKGVGLRVGSGVNTGVMGSGVGSGVDLGVGLVETFKKNLSPVPPLLVSVKVLLCRVVNSHTRGNKEGCG